MTEEKYFQIAPELTTWENEPSVADLKQDYEAAQSSYSTQIAKIDRWLDNLNVTGSAKVEKVRGRSSIVPKLIRKQAEWRYAALSEPFLSNEDLFKTEPLAFGDKEAAIQNGLILNNQFNNQIKKVNFIDTYVRTAVDEGTVIVRVGWESEEQEEEVEISIIQPNGSFIKTKQTVTKVIKNAPTVDVCDYRNIIIDPTCNGILDKADFVIYAFETSLSDLEKSGKYTNLEYINVEGSSILKEPDSSANSEYRSFNFSDKPRKKFMAYEYWGFWDTDNTGMTKPIVATWVGDVMIRMEDSPFPDGKLPFVLVQYLPKRFSIYGEPDGELLEDNQKIVGAVTRGMIDIMGRSAAGQQGIRMDALDITNRRKYETGQDYEFNSHIDPRTAIYSHTYPEIPQSAQFMLELQNNEAEALTGVKAFYGGISGEGLGPTATGIRGALDAASKRELGILRRLAEGIKEIGYKIMAMNALFLSDQEVIRITDEEFVTINREDLIGRVGIKLDINTAEAENLKAQELSFMLQTLGNKVPFEFTQRIMGEIARLRKMPELRKDILTYKEQPNPMAEKLQQLELMKLQAEIAKLQSEADENKANAMLDVAKTKLTASQADKVDLDFLEQDRGTAHQKELEKQGAQARANMQLKALEAGFKGSIDLLKNSQ